jgi:hypothetical protein
VLYTAKSFLSCFDVALPVAGKIDTLALFHCERCNRTGLIGIGDAAAMSSDDLGIRAKMPQTLLQCLDNPAGQVQAKSASPHCGTERLGFP